MWPEGAHPALPPALGRTFVCTALTSLVAGIAPTLHWPRPPDDRD